jgi:hypothetical protein
MFISYFRYSILVTKVLHSKNYKKLNLDTLEHFRVFAPKVWELKKSITTGGQSLLRM